MNRHIPGFRFYRMADDGGSSGGAAAAAGTSATTTTNADGTATTVGQAASASQAASSASASVPSVGTTTNTVDAAAPDFKTALGEYAKDPALADFKDPQSLAKSYLETKKLVGQKLGIPGADATPEAKAAFEKAMGVPDAPEGYGLDKLPDGTPEEIKAGFDPEHAKKWAGIFKANGVPAPVAKALQGEMMKEVMAEVEAMRADTTRTDGDFDKIATATFGDKKQAVMQSAQVDIIKYAPKELRQFADKLPNTMLALVAATVNGVRKELGGEDHAIGTDGQSTTGANAGQLRQEARTLMALPEYSSPFAKGKEAHEAAKVKVQNLFKQVAELEKQGGKK